MGTFEWIGRIVIGLGVGFLLLGAMGAIAAAMLSARITHEQEQTEREQDWER